ncbi:MAG TPA: hypothetical protein VKA94_03765 [Hyphomicrobiales bacterium]|nr:hypothetical protein [Hyphomicrobiales bacterium]
MILTIPWVIVAIILYNVIAFTVSAPGDVVVFPVLENMPQDLSQLDLSQVNAATLDIISRTPFDLQLFSIGMISDASWTLTLGDLVIVITLILLFVELIKATRTGGSSIVDHALSTILFVLCLVEFLLVPEAATSVFFFIMIVTLIDVVAGFSITIRAARRDFGFGGASG